jgi:SAM-dependent methyltransferase
MEFIKTSSVRAKYNSRDSIWSEDDSWHYSIHRQLCQETKRFINSCKKNSLILNAGSASPQDYLQLDNIIHIDIADSWLPRSGNSICCSIERLPFNDKCFEHCICVGSVVNYCSLLESVNEISRVLKPGGTVLFDIETSSSFEFLFSARFNKCVDIYDPTYNGGRERIWIYSTRYIKDVARLCKLEILTIKSLNIMPSLLCALGLKEEQACSAVFLDKMFVKVPAVRYMGSNLVFICRKHLL